MRQEYDKYKEEDFKVWKVLFERQAENLQNKACEEYISCLQELKGVLNSNIPKFTELRAALLAKNGWSIEVVPGLIEVEDFFELLSRKKFCSSTWLRRMDQLDYLEEPDMFHDTYGHIPLFMNKEYGEFAQKMGEIGVKHKDNPQVLVELQRLYWFTIEFGLLKNKAGDTKIYGAGIISSFGEANHIYESDAEILPFDLNQIINTKFCVSEIQTTYFQITSYSQLYESIMAYEKSLNQLKMT